MKIVDGGVCAPKGFMANGLHCGIRQNRTRNDLSMIYSSTKCAAAAVYTTNKVQGAPIAVTKEHIQDGYAQAILCNSGNANTCNADGIDIANAMSASAAKALGLAESDIVIASTGVIGQPLPLEPICSHMQPLVDGLSKDGNTEAALGIMTTDTIHKEYAVQFELQGVPCTVGAMAKGSGMIHPNMATMLAFVTCDAKIEPSLLQEMIHEVADDTFNMVSVDGDTSTNDTFAILCNGQAENAGVTQKDEAYDALKAAVYHVCETMSRMLAKDGEGATKLLTCTVHHGCSVKDAKAIAKSIISSTLFKCAMFGRDANWGRILCAIGYADAQYEVNSIDVTLASKAGSVQVCENGRGSQDPRFETGFDEELALKILAEDEIEIIVDLKDGQAEAKAWGCDMTYDYVKINGDYRT